MARKETTKVVVDNGPVGFVLFVAWIGAFAYFLQNSDFLYAFFKSIVWPAYLMYYLLEFLGVA